jgi:hypothetical protein
MGKYIYIGLIVAANFIFVREAESQFVQFIMTVDTETGVSVESILDFGMLNPNQRTTVRLGDASMGIFSITAVSDQYLFVELEMDEFLLHSNIPDCDTDLCRLGVDLQAAYANQGQRVGDIRGAFVIRDGRAMFPVLDAAFRRRAATLHTSYIYVFGSIDAGDVVPGVYTGNATLRVEFQ